MFTKSIIRLYSTSLERFKDPNSFAFQYPIDDTDIEGFVVKVKTMSLAAYAKGSTNISCQYFRL